MNHNFGNRDVDYWKGVGEYWLAYLGYNHGPMATRRSDRPKFVGEALVVVTSPFLPHPVTKGYTSPIAQVIHEVNGVPTRTHSHLAETLRDATGDDVVISFAGSSPLDSAPAPAL
jgi:hypothetical protein